MSSLRLALQRLRLNYQKMFVVPVSCQSRLCVDNHCAMGRLTINIVCCPNLPPIKKCGYAPHLFYQIYHLLVNDYSLGSVGSTVSPSTKTTALRNVE